MFKHREQILIQFDELVDQQIIKFIDIINLLKYAVQEMGISDNTITKIVIEYIMKLNNEKTKQ